MAAVSLPSSQQKQATPPFPLHQPPHFAKKQWKTAAVLARDLPDPWAELGFERIAQETVTRHMYNPRSGRWKTDQVVIKVQSEPFAHGAMRECFRMKKLSKFSQHPNWKNASNYVAKRYMKAAENSAYFDDVKLQMDAKLWGEEYNRLAVPKKVDFCQTYIIEFKGREGSPLYGVEHFIDGGYVKYNSNSGFVSDVNRLTPQTFSHFSFERSNHRLIVVDIQGVGDLYTNPQMHTADMKDYGEANLGMRGMALFFSSHICSPLCELLGLTQFDLSEEELECLRSRRWNFSTATTKISDLLPPLPQQQQQQQLKQQVGGASPAAMATNTSFSSSSSFPPSSQDLEPDDSAIATLGPTVREVYRRLSINLVAQVPLTSPSSSFPLESPLPLDSPLDGDWGGGGGGGGPFVAAAPLLRVHKDSENLEEEEGEEEGEGEVMVEEGGSNLLPDPGSGSGRRASVKRIEEERGGGGGGGIGGGGIGGGVSGSSEDAVDSLCILGMVHLHLASYHEMGRFSEDPASPDLPSTLYHLTKAAHCGVPEALYTLAHVYLQQPHDTFAGLSVEVTAEHEWEGMEFLVAAGEQGVRAAMLEVARALDTGVGLGKAPNENSQRNRNWKEAIDWYSRAATASTSSEQNKGVCSHADPSSSSPLDEPDYTVLARAAEMLCEGGHGLEKAPQRAGELYTEAAEAAMNAMKGRTSTKYYMLAEEAWSQLPESEY